MDFFLPHHKLILKYLQKPRDVERNKRPSDHQIQLLLDISIWYFFLGFFFFLSLVMSKLFIPLVSCFTLYLHLAKQFICHYKLLINILIYWKVISPRVLTMSSYLLFYPRSIWHCAGHTLGIQSMSVEWVLGCSVKAKHHTEGKLHSLSSKL